MQPQTEISAEDKAAMVAFIRKGVMSGWKKQPGVSDGPCFIQRYRHDKTARAVAFAAAIGPSAN